MKLTVFLHLETVMYFLSIIPHSNFVGSFTDLRVQGVGKLQYFTIWCFIQPLSNPVAPCILLKKINGKNTGWVWWSSQSVSVRHKMSKNIWNSYMVKFILFFHFYIIFCLGWIAMPHIFLLYATFNLKFLLFLPVPPLQLNRETRRGNFILKTHCKFGKYPLGLSTSDCWSLRGLWILSGGVITERKTCFNVHMGTWLWF